MLSGYGRLFRLIVTEKTHVKHKLHERLPAAKTLIEDALNSLAVLNIAGALKQYHIKLKGNTTYQNHTYLRY